MKKKLFAVVLSPLLAASAFVGVSVATAGSASAAGCEYNQLVQTKAYNENCTWAQIWNKVNGSYIYGSKVSPATWTKMDLCYANVTSYGVKNSGVRANYN